MDALGQAYVTGRAGSMDFPTTATAYEPQYVSQGDELSAFVTCVSADGSTLTYSTYLSGTGQGRRSVTGDYASGIVVDPEGDAYVVGTAQSSDFPLSPDAYQSMNNQNANPSADYFPGNAFLTELDPTGSSLVYSSYLGGGGSADGAGGDKGTAIALDFLGNAYITGHTLSSNFPVTSEAYQGESPAYAADHGDSGNAFVAQFGIGTSSILLPTSTTVIASVNPVKMGSEVTFTAKVRPIAGIGTPSGTVLFSIDGGAGVAVPLDGKDQATYATSTLPAASHQVVASYMGDVDYVGSSNSLTETVTSGDSVAYPRFTPVAGTYDSAQRVTIEDATPGAAIYYTTDETEPTSASARYTQPVMVYSTMTVKAIAIKSGLTASAVASSRYTIVAQSAAKPLVSLEGGVDASPQIIDMRDATPGATIYYTTDGTMPTEYSARYTGPVTVTASETIEAVAMAPGYAPSGATEVKLHR